MKKRYWWQSWPRFMLWLHVIGVAGFYLVLWLRTAPDKKDRVKKLPSKNASSTTPGPLVSIIVPARNEERNIERCVISLLEQDYEHFEVIAVDDASTDQTGRVLDQLAATHPHGDRLWTLRLRDLPAGWAGKPHALYRGTQEAHGEWLLFTDADTWHAPNALRSALTQALEEQTDMLTLAATQELPTFWDKVLMPMAFLGISMQYPPKLVNDPSSPVAIATGPYILIKREVYDLLGGYGRPDLRNTLLDDRDLARVVKENGFKLHFIDGEGLVRVHMYQGFDEIWRGWRKNAFLGSRGGVAFTLLQLVGLPMVTVIPFLLPVLAHLAKNRRVGRISGPETALATTVALAPLLAYRTWLNRQMHIPWPYVFTHPLAGAVFEGILGQSTWRVLTGRGVDWRGRAYYNGRQEKAGSSLSSVR
ncbi:MAG TPA: glycosyltransferase [Ktedonosporobacter sp.]|nr:glycosyltransferase [Ktedonosporobacter sp.]